MRRRDPNEPCVNTVNVTSLEETLKTVGANGGQCVVPKMPIPGIGWLAYCKDLDGHIFGICSPTPRPVDVLASVVADCHCRCCEDRPLWSSPPRRLSGRQILRLAEPSWCTQTAF